MSKIKVKGDESKECHDPAVQLSLEELRDIEDEMAAIEKRYSVLESQRLAQVMILAGQGVYVDEEAFWSVGSEARGNVKEVVKMLEQEYAGLEDDYD